MILPHVPCQYQFRFYFRLQPTTNFIILWDFLMFYQIFFSPQVKWCAIITYEHSIYELTHELPKFDSLVLSLPVKMEVLLIFLKIEKLDFSHCVLFHMKPGVSLNDPMSYCLWIPLFFSNSPQNPSNLISLTFLVAVSSHCLDLKLEQLSGSKVLKFALLGNCFSDLFTEVEIWY